MNKDIIQNSLKSQREFYNSGITREYEFRKNMLQKLKDKIMEKQDDILNALEYDLGKSHGEGIMSEVGMVVSEINLTLKHLKKWMSVEKKRGNLINIPSNSFVVKEPYGNVLIISPWNYPFELAISPLIGAISGGNCVTIKPSEFTPKVSRIIYEIIHETYPQDYINVFLGDEKVGAALLEVKFDMIFFTGSTNVGKIVMEKAAKHLTPVILELGGKSPCIVDESINIKNAAKKIAFGKCLNSGQTCVAPDYLLLKRDMREEFYREFQKSVEEFYGTKVRDSEDYGRIINQGHFERIVGYLGDGKIIYGGENDKDKLFIHPTIIELEDTDGEIMKDEIFGPVLPVILFDDLEEIIEVVSMNPNPLALYVFSENGEFIKRIIDLVPSGGCCINDTIMHFTNENLPFGGRGASGMGRYHGKYSFDAFTHEKGVLEKKIDFEFKEKFPPYDKGKLKMIKRIFGLK